MDTQDDGVEGEIAEAINDLLSLDGLLTQELARVSQEVVRGDLRARVKLERASGQWVEQERCINQIVEVFAQHTAELHSMMKFLHAGDLARNIAAGPETIHRGGDLLALADEVNATFSHLKTITSEVNNVLAQVSLDGKLSYQRQNTDANGAWAVLVGGLHAATGSLSEQMRELCEVATALGSGKLATRVTLGMHGDLHDLKLGLNHLAESMACLCAEILRVAHEVVTEGKLSAELRHPDPRGEWQQAQDGYNRILAALASALRQASEATKRLANDQYEVESTPLPPGELGALGACLRELARKEAHTKRELDMLIAGRFDEVSPSNGSDREKALSTLRARVKSDWLRATRIGLFEAREKHRNPADLAQAALSYLMTVTGATIGALYLRHDERTLTRAACLGCGGQEKGQDVPAAMGEGLVGRAALGGLPVYLEKLESSAVRVWTGLLEIVPASTLLFPVMSDGHAIAVVELAFIDNAGSMAQELLQYLHNDLAAGLERVKEQPAAEPSNASENIRELKEELLVSHARLEHMKNEMAARDAQLRQQQSEIEALGKLLPESLPARSTMARP